MKKTEITIRKSGNRISLYRKIDKTCIGSFSYEIRDEYDTYVFISGLIKNLDGKNTKEKRNYEGDYEKCIYMMPRENFERTMVNIISSAYGKQYYLSKTEFHKLIEEINKIYKAFEETCIDPEYLKYEILMKQDEKISQ